MNNEATEIIIDATWLDGVLPWIGALFALSLVAVMIAGVVLLFIIAKVASRPRVPFVYSTMTDVAKRVDTIVIHE